MWRYLDRNNILDTATQMLKSLRMSASDEPVPADTFGRSKMIRELADSNLISSNYPSHPKKPADSTKAWDGLDRKANRGNRSRLAFKAYAPRISPMRFN